MATIETPVSKLIYEVGTRVPAELQAHGYTLGHEAKDFTVGEVVYGHSRGALRRGVVSNVGRTRVTFEYTTRGAITDAATYGGPGARPAVTRPAIAAELVWKAGVR